MSICPIIKLYGNELQPADLQNLVELRIERQFQMPARCTLRFRDGGYVMATVAAGNAEQPVVITEPGTGAAIFTGNVTTIALEQRPEHLPELVITALDASYKLGGTVKAQSFSNMSPEALLQQVLQSAGLTVDMSEVPEAVSATFDYWMQADSDLGILTEMARRYGCDWWVDEGGTTLYFWQPKVSGPTVSLGNTDGSLISLSVRASALAPTSVSVAGWDNKAQDVVNGSASSPSAGIVTSDPSNFAQFGTGRSGGSVFAGGLGVVNADEANAVGQAVLDRFAAGAVRAEGVADGTASITLGCTVDITDFGPLAGSYPVTRVEHTYHDRTGWTTRFWSGDRQPTTLVDTLSAGAAAAGATLFRSLGLTVGKVTSIKDPNTTGRVQVLYPGLGEQYVTGWARVVAPGGGASRGGVFVPEVEDEVLIGFECGDSRRPVVIGGLYGSASTIPGTYDASTGNLAARSLTSRLGHVFSLLDGTSEDQQAIEMVLAGTQTKMHIGKDQVTLVAADSMKINIQAGGSGGQITLNSDGVTIQGNNITLTGQQKVAVSAPQVQVSADTQLQLASNATASLQAQATLQISSDGPLSVKSDAMVQIN